MPNKDVNSDSAQCVKKGWLLKTILFQLVYFLESLCDE